MWRTRLHAILDGKGLWRYIDSNEADDEEEDNVRRVSSIIVQGLIDMPLRVIINDLGNPRMMMEKLRHRYASSNMTSGMSLMFQLHHLKYKGGEMGEYVDKYTCLLDQLESMEARVPESLAVIMFLSSLDESHLLVPILAVVWKSWNEVRTSITKLGEECESLAITTVVRRLRRVAAMKILRRMGTEL